MEELSQKEWRERLEKDDNCVILDVRTPAEMDEGYIPGAKLMDIYNTAAFYEMAKKLDTGKNYYVYCRSGARSAQACMLFNSLGIKNSYNLKGGIEEWNGTIKH